MTAANTPFGQRPPAPAAIIVVTAFMVSAIRGLGHPTFGPLPALGRFEWFKFVDVAVVLSLAGLGILHAVRHRVTRFPRWKIGWALATGLIFVIGLVSALVWSVPRYYAAQSMLFALRPLVVLLVMTAFSWSGRGAGWYGRVVVGFILVNFALVLAEWRGFLWIPAVTTPDGIVGLLHDAHQQATFAYTAAILALPSVEAASGRRRLAWIAFVAANVIGGFLSQGQKATGVELITVVAAAIVLLARSRARLLRGLIIAPFVTAAVVVVALLASGPGSWIPVVEVVSGNLMNRLEAGGYRGVTFLNDVGLVRMVADFGDVVDDRPLALAIGIGPSNYGSPAAMTRLSDDKALPLTRRLFWREVADEEELAASGELRLLGLSAKSSLFGVILGEYGLLALAAIVGMLIWLMVFPPGERDRPDTNHNLFWTRVAFIALVIQSALSTLGAWDNDVVTTLLMIGFAAVLARRDHPSPPEADAYPV